MSTDWRSEYREATAAPHPAVKERVWRSMQAPKKRSVRVVTFVATASLVLVAGFVAWPKTTSTSRQVDGFAWVSTNARVDGDGAALALHTGTLQVSAWSTPVTVKAAGKTVSIDAAIASITVAGDAVAVVANEGTVLVDGARLRATPGSDLSAVLALESAEAPILRAEAAADLAATERRWDDASTALSVVAASSSLRAESALLKRGELEFRQLKAPARALASFDEGDARFPSGSLSLERALSALEATVALSRWPDVVTRADAFLSRFPDSERLDEVRAVRASALQAQGKTAEACTAAKALKSPPPFFSSCP